MIKKIYNIWRLWVIKKAKIYDREIFHEQRDFELEQRKLFEKEMAEYVKNNPAVLELYIPVFKCNGHDHKSYDWESLRSGELKYFKDAENERWQKKYKETLEKEMNENRDCNQA